jgi:hypothetical protein
MEFMFFFSDLEATMPAKDFLHKSLIINVIYRTGLRAKLFSQTV